MRRYDYTDGRGHAPNQPPIEAERRKSLWRVVFDLIRQRRAER